MFWMRKPQNISKLELMKMLQTEHNVHKIQGHLLWKKTRRMFLNDDLKCAVQWDLGVLVHRSITIISRILYRSCNYSY